MKELLKAWGPNVFSVLAIGGLVYTSATVRDMQVYGTPGFQRHEAKDDERIKAINDRLDKLEAMNNKLDDIMVTLRKIEFQANRTRAPKDNP